MLAIAFNNQIYKMYWTYEVTTEEKSYKRGNSTVNISTKVRYTGIILQADDVLHTAYVRCNPEDNFSRETGRLLTIDKVTENLHPELASLIYKTYHSRK